MLIQQMKSTCSIKIEADNVHSPTGHSCEKLSPNDTPSIAVANYDHYKPSIPHEKSTTKSIKAIHTAVCSIHSPFISGTESRPFDNLRPWRPFTLWVCDTISIHKSLLLPIVPIGRRGDRNQRFLDRFAFLFMVSLNLPHVTRLDSGSVV